MAAKRLPPIRPGEILRKEFVVPMKLSSNAVARAIGATPARVNEIVNESRGITADTALRLGRYCGTTADVWINLQKRFELETARRELGDALKRIHPRAPGHPRIVVIRQRTLRCRGTTHGMHRRVRFRGNGGQLPSV